MKVKIFVIIYIKRNIYIMLTNHITKLDKFDPKILDHDTIIETKKYFNIYNNSIDEPLHKFWFLAENAKFINIYNSSNTNNQPNQIIRFALNNKNDKTKKLITYWKELGKHLEKIFYKTFDKIIVDYPWKDIENYPYMMNFSVNTNTIYTNVNDLNKPKEISDLNKESIYSLLFDITYIQISKVSIDNIDQYYLKFKLSLLMIQETNINLKLFSLVNLEQNNYTKSNIILPPQNLFTNTHTNTHTNNHIHAHTHAQINAPTKSIDLQKGPQLFLNPSELIARKSTLNKITLSDNKIISTNEIDEIIDIKNQLKRVDTDERSLLKHLKKEHNEHNDNIVIVPIKKKKKKVKIDLEKEFNELSNNNS
jgi:hypothetical protein